MDLPICIPVYGIGGQQFTVEDYMYRTTADPTVEAGYVFRIKNASGTNWTRVGDLGSNTVAFSNPSSDTTFTILMEESENDKDWFAYRDVTGILYHSLGGSDISFTLVNSAIGSSIEDLSRLCTASTINRYSLYKPNGLSPYNLGDFRYYTPNAVGGLDLMRYVDYTGVNNTINWNTNYTIWGIASKFWFETQNRPFAHSKLRIYENGTLISDGDDTDISSTSIYTLVSHAYKLNNITSGDDTTIPCTISSWHLYSGTWYKDKEISFNIKKQGKPWSATLVNKTHVGDTLTINWTCSKGGTLRARARAYDKLGVLQEEITTLDAGTASVSSDDGFPVNAGLTLEVEYYPNQWTGAF